MIKNQRHLAAEQKAKELAYYFKNPSYEPFYFKVAMGLSESQIESFKELAAKKTHSGRYFSYLCNKTLKATLNIGNLHKLAELKKEKGL